MTLWSTLILAQLPTQEGDAVTRYRQAHAAAILQSFAEFLAIPNVASNPACLARNADWLQAAFAARGFTMHRDALDGVPPLVYGELKAARAKRTLGLYAHYDGQPVSGPGWMHSPWQPTLHTAPIESGGAARALPTPGDPIDPEWRLYARGAGDDKAPVIALLAALDAMRANNVEPSSHLVLLFDGEEEAGSPHLPQYLERHTAELAVDAWLFCDGPVHHSRAPLLAFGARGVCGLDITVYGATRELHSGHYGNWAPNPALELARLLASMKDEDGWVRVPGFYDSTRTIDADAEAAIAAMPDLDQALRNELGLARTEAGGAPLAKRLMQPSLNIRGLASATAGDAARNVIPSTATASLDVRLVSGNDPAKMLDLVEAHIAKQGFHIVREDPDPATRLLHAKIARVVRSEGYPASQTPMGLGVVKDIIAATRRAARANVVLMPTLGGSLPLYLFTGLLARPTVIVPIANHDDNQHAANENLRIANLWYGIDVMAALLTMP